jgi:hypothetical protein
MAAYQAQKVEIVFPFKKDEIAVVASIVEMVVMVGLKLKMATWHEDVVRCNLFFRVPMPIGF